MFKLLKLARRMNIYSFIELFQIHPYSNKDSGEKVENKKIRESNMDEMNDDRGEG